MGEPNCRNQRRLMHEKGALASDRLDELDSDGNLQKVKEGG